MVIDRIVPEKLEPIVDYLPAVSIDLNMLCGLGGYEGTHSEHRGPLAKGWPPDASPPIAIM